MNGDTFDCGPDAAPAADISYRYGLAVLRPARLREAPRWMRYDPRLDALTAPGHRFPELRSWAERHGIVEAGPAQGPPGTPLFDPRTPRDYQQEALDGWLASGGRGTVVLPTGAGKSFVAMLAIHRVGAGACVVAPTRALLAQWFAQLADAFGADRVGAFYGDEKDVRRITVTTYHSAFSLLERWGAEFDLLVLDEVHHLADRGDGAGRAWHDILRIAPAARRLGLTATYPDAADTELRRLVGPVAYRRGIGEMADRELARFAMERRFVRLTDEEREAYDRRSALFHGFMDERGYSGAEDTAEAWRSFMLETRRSPRARRALRAWTERDRIVALAERKLDEVERILRLFPAERSILFCGRTDAAAQLSRRLAVPMIGANTPASERKAVLDGITSGRLRAVVSVRVLDEGWDVPAAKLGVILGDTTRGSPRQQTQRLGRLLRRQGDSVASLFEVVVADTHEFFASQRRGTAVRAAAEGQLGLGI